eukprot:183106_1
MAEANKMENVDLDDSHDTVEPENKDVNIQPKNDTDKKSSDKDTQTELPSTEASQTLDSQLSESSQPAQPAKKFQLGAIASGVGKTFTSIGKKTISAASSVTTTVTTSINAAINKRQASTASAEQKDSLYRGDFKDMQPPKDWKPKKKLIANPGSIVRRQKRVLITGGAGFLGSHLTDALMDKGYDVIVCDNLFSGQKCNIYKWFGNPNFEFMRHDVCNPLYVEVDEIYHLACPASPVFYQNNPIKTVKTCFMGTMYMLGLAKRVGARILLTSTSEIYGDPKVHPQTEEYWGNVNNIGIRSCYDEGKRISETLMFEYYRQHNVDIAVARIFNTYGPRMLENDGRVVSNFIIQALKGEKLTIYGNGSQTRSFCYVDDQIRGLISLMESGEVGPINIGNPNEYTISELAKMTCKLVNMKLGSNHTDFAYKDLPSDDPKKRKPDITKAKKLLKWNPKVNLQQGLGSTIDYFIDYFGMNKNDSNKNDNNTNDNTNDSNDNDTNQ